MLGKAKLTSNYLSSITKGRVTVTVWQYKTVFVRAGQGDSYTETNTISDRELAGMGADGWELVTSEPLYRTVWDSHNPSKPTIVGVVGINYIFKRSK